MWRDGRDCAHSFPPLSRSGWLSWGALPVLYIRNSPQPSKPSSGSLWWRWLFTEVAPVRSLAQEFLCALGAAKGGKKPQHRHPLLQAACHNLPARRFPPLRSPSLGRTALTLELTLHLPPPPWATCHPHLYLGRTGAPSASTGIDMKTLILPWKPQPPPPPPVVSGNGSSSLLLFLASVSFLTPRFRAR